jgi:outer membrane protein assembly factor BamB
MTGGWCAGGFMEAARYYTSVRPDGETMRKLIAFFTCLLVASAGALTHARAAQAPPDALRAAAGMVKDSGAAGGFCTVVGRGDAELALAVAKQGRFVVHCLAPTAGTRDALRQAIRAHGLYGTVSATMLSGKRLPYATNLMNLAIVGPNQSLDEALARELFRVLAPLGAAYVQAPEGAAKHLRSAGLEDVAPLDAGGPWLRARKSWPADMDEWTHYLHGADGNPVARDTVVGPPQHYQWVAGPMFQRSHETDSSLSTLVTARGRLFAIVDRAPISVAGEHSLPDKWVLEARDAFNGTRLWSVPIRRWGWREWKPTWFNLRPGDIPLNVQKRLVAAGDTVYATLGYVAPVSQLDARTGELLQTYADTERTNEILHRDGTLFLSLLRDGGVRVAAVDAGSGKRNWTSEAVYSGSTVDYVKWGNRYGRIEPPPLDPASNLATDGTVVALLDGNQIACLDAATGAEKWRSSFPLDPKDQTAGGIRAKGNLWVGTLIVADGTVIHASPHKLGALDAETGKLLWSQPKNYIGHLWYEWKDVFVIDGRVWTWGAELKRGVLQRSGKRKQHSRWPTALNGYDLKTGKLEKEVALGPTFKTHHHHRCYRNKATSRYVMASRRGTEFIDLAGGPHTVDNWVRGTCHVGMMPANGLQYAPPHPCACYMDEKLSGFNALAPARPETYPPPDADSEERLERGPAFGKATGPAAQEDDWPAFRHDALRTGAVKTAIADGATEQARWRVSAGRRVSPPVVVGNRLYAALVDEHHVLCLDAEDGKTVWSFAAGGRVDSPPTYHQGMVLFGSMDGWVYALRATDGALAWRFRAAPRERLMGAFGQLESTWPVHGSVLVQDGTAYCAAGRTSQLDGGIILYALDAATGEVRHQRTLEGPRYTSEEIEENYRLPMGTLPDVLMSDGSNIYMRSETFNAKLEPQRGGPALRTRSGFLDDSYFKRMPWTLGGDYGRLIVHDHRSVYYVRMFDTLRGLDPTVYFTPGSKGYMLFAKNMKGKRKNWMGRIPVRVRAMALAGERLLVAGPPDVLEKTDPLGAFEGRKGGWLYAIDPNSGDTVAKRKLPSPPVFNGIAAARGRLYLADEAGHITCFGGEASGGN